MTQHSLTAVHEFDVAIIGGGAAGVLVAIHLLSSSKIALRIAIIEPQSELGQGAAYSTVYPEHLLNVIASRMSALPSDPDHFVRFLAAQGKEQSADDDKTPLAHRFARRLDFGRYLRATLAAQPGAEQVQWLHEEAVDIERDAATSYTIRLRSGAAMHARSVVLAIGNFARGIPLPATAIHGEPKIINAWDYPAIRGIGPEADVCIIGSGLSMVDAVISLASTRHRGKITVLSRHGLMPLPHAMPGPQEGDVKDLLDLSIRQRLRALRALVTAGEENGEPWQWTMDRLRPHVQSMWTRLSRVEQRRFLRHAARFWDIHRHRIAPSVAEQIDALRLSGQFEICAGRLDAIARGVDGTQVRFRPRNKSLDREIRADYVINSTGMESNIKRMKSSLVEALERRCIVAAGLHGIGIATDQLGAVVSTDGEVSDNLHTLGALRVGQLWESIAVPELRDQARRIADAIRQLMEFPPPEHERRL